MEPITLVFDESNINWSMDNDFNYLFLRGVRQHAHNVLQVRGHIFVNDILDMLHAKRDRRGVVFGWLADQNLEEPLFTWGVRDEGKVLITFHVPTEPIHEKI